ncbi:polysaccharide biosynthesis tyrosine autokinase [Pasteurella sp. PK-2025]|uniref:polysaccharide biosynthesis tyrosine autokinase n=1 Tax=Pasteurella sp. PK-2025 TaxID=3413133 RepID=UPI003C749C6E
MSEHQHDETIDLMKLFNTLLDHKWWIIIFTLLTTTFGIGYAFFSKPIYLANATIQIEDKASGSVLKDFTGIFEEKSSSNTEMAIIRSRMVLSHAVNQLNLATKVTPLFSVPVFSKMLAFFSDYQPKLGIYYFAPFTEETKSLIVEVGDTPDHYNVYSAQTSEKLLEGVVGTLYQSDNLHLAISTLQAKAGQRFFIEKLNDLSVISNLQNEITVSEVGKQTGIISISAQGHDKKYIKEIVASVAESYLLQNVARNSAEASKSLEFLNNQLPEIRQKLSDSENRLNEFRLQNESVDLSYEARATLETIVHLEADLNELTIKESEIAQKFTRNHPAYVALIDKRNVLNAEKERLNKQLEKLPNTQKEIIRLTRDLEVNQQIYIQLLNKMQELDVVKASTIGNVRLLDSAQVFPDPIAPKKSLIIFLAMMLGLALSGLAIMLKHFFNRGIESVSEIEKAGFSTYAIVPYSAMQPSVSLKHPEKGKKGLLSEHYPDDNAIEAIRSLRTSLHFSLLEAKNNIVMISGTVPDVGKSFISANLANVLSKTGKKVLLIDADLRRSYLHNNLKLDNTLGLSEAILQDIPFENAIKQYGSLDIITKGHTPPNPSELFYTERFQQLLEWASRQYDLVLVDTPPILPVTDAAIIGKYAGTLLLVGRFAKTTMKEIETARKRFEQAGIHVNGFILNGAKTTSSNYYEYYGYKSYT